MTEFLPFNERPLRTLENHSGTRECKVGRPERVSADPHALAGTANYEKDINC